MFDEEVKKIQATLQDLIAKVQSEVDNFEPEPDDDESSSPYEDYLGELKNADAALTDALAASGD